MKYITEIIINLSRDKFLKKLQDPENMKHWQKGLTGYEILSGKPDEEGAKIGYEL